MFSPIQPISYFSICKLAYKSSKANICPIYGRTNDRPIIKTQKFRLLPYMVIRISTGNGRNVHQNPFKFENFRNIQTKKIYQTRRQLLISSNTYFNV